MRGTVTLRNVLILSQTATGWSCECLDHPNVRFIGITQVAPGTPMPSVGTKGTVTVTATAADELGVRPHP